MLDGLGALFAPTAENAQDAPQQGSIEGLPAAIKILSLRMPKFLGARGLAPDDLMHNRGAAGQDPFASSVMQTLISTLLAPSGTPNPVIIPGQTGPEGGTLTEAPPPLETSATPIPGQRPPRLPPVN